LNSKQTAKLTNTYNRLAESDRAKLAGLPLPPLAGLALFNRVARQLPDRALGAYADGPALESHMLALADKFEIPALIAHQPPHWQSLPGWPKTEKAQTLFALDAVTKADPDNLNSVPQIVKWLRHPQHAALPEDLPGIRDDLRAFERIKLTLPQEQQQLSHYPHIQALRRALPQTNASIEQRQLYEQKALTAGDAQLLWRDENNENCLIHITSERGAQQLGRHTKWCTAWGGPDDPQKKSEFPNYADDLLYLRKGTDVYQLCFTKKQFMNVLDAPVQLAQLVNDRPEMKVVLCGPLARSMEIMAANGCVNDMADVLKLCWKSGVVDLQKTAISGMKSHLPTAMKMASEFMRAWSMTNTLTTSNTVGDNNLQQLVITTLKPDLPAAITTMSALDEVHGLTELFNTCWKTYNPELQRMSVAALISTTPVLMKKLAEDGQGYKMGLMLTTCHDTGDQNLLETATQALADNLPIAMSTMADKVENHNIACLLRACQKGNSTSLQKAAISALKPNLPRAISSIIKGQLSSVLSDLLTTCYEMGDAGLVDVARTSLDENKTKISHMTNCTDDLQAALVLYQLPTLIGKRPIIQIEPTP